MTDGVSESTHHPHFGFFVPGEAVLVVTHNPEVRGDALRDAILELLPSNESFTALPALTQAIGRVNFKTEITTLEPPEANAIPEPEPEPEPRSEEPRGCSQMFSMLLDMVLNRPASGTQRAAPASPSPSAQADRPATRHNEVGAQSSSQSVSSITLNIGAIDERWNDPQNFIEGVLPDELVNKLNESEGITSEDGSVSITAIAPNWLLNCAQPILTVGGPGARPVKPATGITPSSVGGNPWDFHFQSVGERRQATETGSGKGVTIYVLDTAPTTDEFTKAYNDWNAINPLIGELLAPGSNRFEVHHAQNASDAALKKLGNPAEAGINGHGDYAMRDHGLFASGIAASIAPEAKVVLIEVLGSQGIGSLQTIADALTKLANQTHERGKVVVNLSLTFDIPFREYVDQYKASGLYKDVYESFEAEQEWGWFLEWLDKHEPYVRKTLCTIEEACKTLIERYEAIIVAAAGNDSYSDVPLAKGLKARFPAAFDVVTGVGALDTTGQRANYSNQADQTPDKGFTTFGGDISALAGAQAAKVADPSPLSADPEKGILGLYIGDLPDKSKALAGWARWAGTSFATPIIAGYLAAALSQNNYLPADAIQQLRASTTGEPTGASQILEVTQG